MCPILESKRLTKSQEQVLVESFKSDPCPSDMDKNQLAESFSISRKRIDMWFANMRKKNSIKEDPRKSE